MVLDSSVTNVSISQIVDDLDTTEEANAAAIAAGLSPDEADAVTDNYADAQLEALKKAMLGVALLALLSLLFTRRLPAKPSTAEP